MKDIATDNQPEEKVVLTDPQQEPKQFTDAIDPLEDKFDVSIYEKKGTPKYGK